MLFPILVLMLAAAAPTPEMETRIAAACEDWWHPLDANDAATATTVPGNGLCINGFIDAGTDAAILDDLRSMDDRAPLLVVVRSGGGEFDATMNVAEALQKRRPTVIADTICASSCANYIITAGERRIVRDGSFLLHHGGITMDLMDQVRPQVEALAKADPTIDTAAAVSAMRATIAGQMARQDAFMARAGVKPEIFAWMGEANSPAAAAAVADCPPESRIIQYSEVALGRFGLDFDHFGAPASQAEVDARLRKLGRDSKICYWQE